MDIGTITDVFKFSISTLITVAAPILLPSLIVGLIVAIFQATTQIQEQTLTFVPKILTILGALAILGPWMLKKLVDYTAYMFNLLPK